MQIKIKQKFNLLSHRYGSKFLIVKTSYFVQIFPALLVFKDLNSEKSFKISLDFIGPVKNFTIFQNLLSGDIKVCFHAQNGYISYKILIREKILGLYFENLPNDQIDIKLEKTKKVNAKEKFELPIQVISENEPKEFLFLGIHKKQDIDLIKNRENLLEILPFLFLFSQFFEDIQSKCVRKNCIVKELILKIHKKEKKDLEDQFLKVYKAHFFDAFIPRVNDEDFQNIIQYVDAKDSNPLHILRKLFYVIKSTLVEANDKEATFLPALPVSVHSGKALNITFPIGSFDIEWSKKLIKKLIFRSVKDVKLKFNFQSKIKTYRLKTSVKEKGKTFKNKDFLYFEKDKIYFFDKFQK